MRIQYFKSKWEMWDAPLEEFLERVASDAYDGTEVFIPALAESSGMVRDLHERYGLHLVAQIVTEGRSAGEHIRSLEERYLQASECGPIKVNAQAGRDIFTFDENVRIFETGIALSSRHGVPLLFETHRGRPTYSAVETRRYLEQLLDLRLTADFSHWMVVHESNLGDQDENVEAAIRRSDHIHARVGHEEGPQIPHPRAPEWRRQLDDHIALWQRIASHQRQSGANAVTITPEFGPPTYMPTLPFKNQPVADTWSVNLEMRRILEGVFGADT